MQDPFDLQRFVDAQDAVFDSVLSELREGQKRSHWMWFVFPQIAGLGHSPMARRFAISSIDEARAYLSHPVLGDRLRKCTEPVNAVADRRIEEIFGYPDVMKFQSSMTLFGQASPGDVVFREALQKYFDGKADDATLERLRV